MKRHRRVTFWCAVAGFLCAAAATGYVYRRSLSAAYVALRHPELVERPAPAAPLELQCPQLITEQPEMLDEAIARDFVELESLDLRDPDSIALATLKPTDLPVAITRRTLRFVKFFGQNSVGRKLFRNWYRRSGRLRNSMEHELREAGLPEDLVWVAAAESGFNPKAVSPAGAAGLWQFMPDAGTLYGLEQSPWIDERLSLTRETTAAVTHLRDLFERLGSWDLALAGYNMGYVGVLRAMQRAVDRRGEKYSKPQHPPTKSHPPLGFPDLAQQRLLPRETADYVPKITALAIVAANLARFNLDDTVAESAIHLSSLAVPEGTRLQMIARAAGISTAVLKQYNPQLLRDRIPPTGGDYLITLPAERLEHARAALPAYLDHEILEAESTMPLPPLPKNLELGKPSSEVLERIGGSLRRPVHLGNNRLPAFPVPGRKKVAKGFQSYFVAPFDSTLPEDLTGINARWKAKADPFGLLTAARNGGPLPIVQDPALEKHLAFLKSGPARRLKLSIPFEEQRLASGILLRTHRDSSAPRVSITVQIATLAPTNAPAPRAATAAATGRHEAAPFGSGQGATYHSDTVARSELDTGLTIAAGRLAMLLSASRGKPVAAIRNELNRVRRADVHRQRNGKAWLTLSAALYPSTQAFGGRVVGPDEPDVLTLRNRLLLADLSQQQRPRRASITLVGDFEPTRAKSQLDRALAQLGPALLADSCRKAPEPPDPPRLIIRDKVNEARALYGWVTAPLGTADEAKLRIALHILAGRKQSRFQRQLVERQLAAAARGFVDPGWPSSATVVELVPVAGQDFEAVERRMEKIIEQLAAEGPTDLELAYAKAIVGYRLKKRFVQGTAKSTDSVTPAILGYRIMESLRPGLLKQMVDANEKVTSKQVMRAVRKYLGTEHRVVVLTVPNDKTAMLD